MLLCVSGREIAPRSLAANHDSRRQSGPVTLSGVPGSVSASATGRRQDVNRLGNLEGVMAILSGRRLEVRRVESRMLV